MTKAEKPLLSSLNAREPDEVIVLRMLVLGAMFRSRAQPWGWKGIVGDEDAFRPWWRGKNEEGEDVLGVGRSYPKRARIADEGEKIKASARLSKPAISA